MRIFILVAFSLTACSAAHTGAPGQGVVGGVGGKASDAHQPSDDCPVIDSRDWQAWVDAKPGQNAPTLHIRGVVDLPTPGYEFQWRVGIADRAYPPGQNLHLAFTAPDGAVAQVVTTMSVAYQGEAAFKAYRMIRIHCGDERLAEIAEVPVAL